MKHGCYILFGDFTRRQIKLEVKTAELQDYQHNGQSDEAFKCTDVCEFDWAHCALAPLCEREARCGYLVSKQ
jgi:hypothetical protein